MQTRSSHKSKECFKHLGRDVIQRQIDVKEPLPYARKSVAKYKSLHCSGQLLDNMATESKDFSPNSINFIATRCTCLAYSAICNVNTKVCAVSSMLIVPTVCFIRSLFRKDSVVLSNQSSGKDQVSLKGIFYGPMVL
uniref:Uncharacterized protein n=1 Tax=Glossina pallidipes TaxID=7398 RepID=A0A1A9ZH63_GLOPL